MDTILNRRRLFAAAAISLSACRKAPARRPNILFVIADDMSYRHAGAYGDKVVRTPNFDRVAGEGVLFTHSYCASPSCTPSRSAVLTGRNIWQVGEAGVLYGTMPPEYPLFPHLLEDAGYFTGFTGKGWSPGDWKAGGLQRCPTGKEYNQRRHPGVVAEGIDPRDAAANFEDFLKERPQGKPFFFWLGSTEPHRVYAKGAGVKAGKKLSDVKVPAYLPDTGEIRSDLLDYYMEVEWFDQQLGRTLELLRKTGEMDDTMIVVTSDNGMPFPRAKVNLYDGGVRMPLAVRWGNRFSSRRVTDFVSHIDFAPTILEAAGVAVPSSMSGRSFLTMMETGQSSAARNVIFTALERHTMCRPNGGTYPMRAIRTMKWLYIRNFAPDRWPTGGPDFISSNKTYHGDVDGCPTKDFMVDPVHQAKYPKEYALCFGKRPPVELYDVIEDPHQVRNLASNAEHVDDLQRLQTDLEKYLRETGDPLMQGLDPWKDYPYRQTAGFGATFNKALAEKKRREALDRGAHKPE